MSPTEPRSGSRAGRPAAGARSDDIAIVGMSCIFPGAGDLVTFWRNVAGGVDAIRAVSPNRWDPEFYDPKAEGAHRVYCRRGGFVDEFASFDALRWGVMPVAAQGGEPDQLLALEVAARALADAGYAVDARDGAGGRSFPRATTGVVLGRGGYISRGMNRFATQARQAEEFVRCLRSIVPDIDDEQIERVRGAYGGWVGHHGPDTVIGIVPNLAASRIANRLDLAGPAYTVDAACASALVAVDRACADLSSGRADLALAGGVHLAHDVSFWSVFCQLGALSRAETIRPFDRRADGILIGEGVGVCVLKRRADAVRDGDRIYAVIRGIGTSSDGRATSLMTPSVEGQVLALERAWKAAGLDPTAEDSVGLIEAHGTGTPAGDVAELETLARVFGPPTGHGATRAGLGSIKSMIGHAMPAAGAAGLIKAALALHHRTLPPTLHCDEPHDAMERTRFRPVRQAEPWEAHGGPRRAAVDAFGFGGINAHVVLEEADAGTRVQVAVGAPDGAAAGAALASEVGRALFLAADTPEDLLEALDTGRPGGSVDGACRLALLDPTPERIAIARKAVVRGSTFRGRKGLWFSPQGLVAAGGKVAFVFPGVDADFQPRVADVAAAFGRPPLPEDEIQRRGGTSLEQTGVGIVLVNHLLEGVVRELGVVPDLLMGHSIGEWSAMIASGVLDETEVDGFMRTLEAKSLEVPGVVFATAGCGHDVVAEALEGLEDIVVSHDNCPHQVVLCGREASVDTALERLRRRAVLCQKLDFKSGFHTPLLRPYVGPLEKDLDGLAVHRGRVPVWSATTCAPYPTDPAEIRKLFVEHLVRPIRFRELAETLWADGVRVFVQVGTGSLVGFLDDSLHERPHLAIASNVPRRSGLAQLAHLASALWVEGVDVDLGRLFPDDAPGRAQGAGADTSGHGARGLMLDLGTPLVRLSPDLALEPRPRSPAPADAAVPAGDSPVLRELAATMEAFRRGGEDVVRALEKSATRRASPSVREPDAGRGGAPQPRPEPPRERTSHRRLDFETCPYLLDHCFFPQPEGWSEPGDRFPVVPMTMSLSIMADAARDLAPDRVVVGIEKVRAYRWIAVEEPVDLTIEARRDGDCVRVKIDGYIEGTVRLGAGYEPGPQADFEPFDAEEPLPMRAEELYSGRWMFHGPSYQGVLELTGIAAEGIRGRIEERVGEGCLLDCAGQLFGLWIQETSVRDKMAMPVTIESIEFHGPDPEPGTDFDCKVWIRRVDELQVRADLDVARGGRVWCRIVGWEDRRFESDEQAWPVMLHPDDNLLAEPHAVIPGAATLVPRLDRVATRDFFARRFLTNREIDLYKSLTPRRQIEWLAGRMAAKDAIRSWLWERGHGPIYPIEVEIRQVESGPDAGRPTVHLAHHRGRRWGDPEPVLEVSIAHKRERAIALVADGRRVGVDVERIEERSEGFERTAFSEAECELLDRAVAAAPADDAREEWVARFWAAKEACGKARGTGLDGVGRSLVIRDVRGDELWIEGQRVTTLREGDLVFAWTIEDEEARDG